jgi:hypothetical protein
MNSIGLLRILFLIFFSTIFICAFIVIIIYRSYLRNLFMGAFIKKSACLFSTVKTFIIDTAYHYKLLFQVRYLRLKVFYLNLKVSYLGLKIRVIMFRNFIFSFHFTCLLEYIVDSVRSFVKGIIPKFSEFWKIQKSACAILTNKCIKQLY